MNVFERENLGVFKIEEKELLFIYSVIVTFDFNLLRLNERRGLMTR
jgi:hypothetical protein